MRRPCKRQLARRRHQALWRLDAAEEVLLSKTTLNDDHRGKIFMEEEKK